MIEACQTCNKEMQRQTKAHKPGALFLRILLSMLQRSWRQLKNSGSKLTMYVRARMLAQGARRGTHERDYWAVQGHGDSTGRSEAAGEAVLEYSIESHCATPRNSEEDPQRPPPRGEGLPPHLELRAVLGAALAK
ncbi:unnamed protein product [Prorocentrum cordatum]|uniref:Uncharacterized protein n=1 Tax=Prorocentrum cordatum TaxID=2364126 RepID=A0ABN9XMC3_9DINO|nr:unnamed protein product [Polarella glacialis]